MHKHTQQLKASALPRGFTIIELLIVIGIIALLASIFMVAAGSILGGAKNAAASRQLQTIVQALQQFESDLGTLPPLLTLAETGDNTVTDPEAEPNLQDMASRLRENRYMSEYSLAIYLLGAGNIDGDPNGRATGANDANDDGQAGPGIRSPGIDKSWGGAFDRAVQRDDQTATRTGRVYGPYLDLGRLSDSLRLDPETGLFLILDPWGQPIRYYKGWPTREIVNGERVPSATRVPIELRTPAALQYIRESGGKPNLGLEREVLNSSFMLLSAGKPIQFNSDGSSLPQFGEIKEDESLLQPSSELKDGTFDPDGLLLDEKDYFLERLESNVRASP